MPAKLTASGKRPQDLYPEIADHPAGESVAGPQLHGAKVSPKVHTYPIALTKSHPSSSIPVE